MKLINSEFMRKTGSLILAVLAGVFVFTLVVSATTSITGTLITLENGETISNGTDGTITLTATNTVLVGTASSSAIRVGVDSNTTVSGIVFGVCNLTTANVIASSTNYTVCSGATGVTSSYKVFVQATSSLPTGLIIDAASSTATQGTISLRVNNVNVGANANTGAISINFWAIR